MWGKHKWDLRGRHHKWSKVVWCGRFVGNMLSLNLALNLPLFLCSVYPNFTRWVSSNHANFHKGLKLFVSIEMMMCLLYELWVINFSGLEKWLFEWFLFCFLLLGKHKQGVVSHRVWSVFFGSAHILLYSGYSYTDFLLGGMIMSCVNKHHLVMYSKYWYS